MNIGREPLLHFLLAGVALFGLAGLVAPAAPADDVIRVGPDEVASIVDQFQAQTSRPPSDAEKSELIDAWIREEVLYREALAMGLDQRDAVVRKRMADKLQFLLEGKAEPAEPDDATLHAWFGDHANDYATEPVLSFEQVCFAADRRADAEGDARAALAARHPEGDPCVLPSSFRDATPSAIAGTFGRAFSSAVAALPAGDWAGPIPSDYGAHLVRITSRTPARIPTFDEVRDKVRQDWLDTQRKAATEAAYAALRARYDVVDPT